MATWFALNELGIGRYSAAYLTAVLIDSTESITIERVQDVLVRISVSFGDKRTTTLERHADRMARNVAKVFPRSSETDRDWVAQSAACIVGLVHFMAENKVAGACHCLDVLAELGWSDVIERLRQRVGSALQSLPPPFRGDLSAAARRLLEQAPFHMVEPEKP
jgi:hypothetical protein